jgi:hypothetical protein
MGSRNIRCLNCCSSQLTDCFENIYSLDEYSFFLPVLYMRPTENTSPNSCFILHDVAIGMSYAENTASNNYPIITSR